MALVEIGRIEGMDKTLRDLKSFDKDLHNEIVGNIKTAMNAAASLAKAKFPPKPMRGWQSKPAVKPIPPKAFPHYNKAQVDKGIEVIVGKKSSKSKRSYKVAALRQNNAGAMVYDLAGSSGKTGKGRSAQFIQNITATGGRASRVMWPAVRAKESQIIATIVDSQKKAETALNNVMAKGKKVI
jgi:hypothetical protein